MPAPLHVAVTGGSGFLGRALLASLCAEGHRVTPLVRRAPRAGEVRWDPVAAVDLTGLGQVDAVVHLAGENIAAGRWSSRRKDAIRESRVRGTTSLVASLLQLPAPPRTLITASAIGIYGDRGTELLTEASDTGHGFLPDVGRAWEEAGATARSAGIRVVHPRFGIVLAPGGGALERMLPFFRLGLGGRLGSGRQWMSWITLEDAIGALHHLLHTTALEGAVNLVSPGPVTNAEFTGTLGETLRRPTFFPAPAGILRLVLGELADEALLASQRVVPTKLEAAGYRFRFPELGAAFDHLLNRLPRPPGVPAEP